jgi:ribose transport system permease protein
MTSNPVVANQPATTDMRRVRRRVTFGLDRFSGLYLWAAFIVVFGVWKPDLFLTSVTLRTVTSQYAVTAMLAIAVLLPLVAGGYDLSVGASANLAAIIAIVFQTNHHLGMWVSIGLAVLAATGVGAINGFLVVRLHVSPIIATLGMATVVSAVQSIVSSDSQPFPPSSPSWGLLSQRTYDGIQVAFFYLIGLALVVWWVLEWTPAGRYLRAIGGNPEAARLAGVATGRWTWLAYIGSGFIAGVAGVIYGSQSGPSLTFGQALLLPAFAAVFLGSTQLTPGRANVWGTLLAVYVLATGVKGMQLVTGVQWLNDMFNGVALLAAVSFAVWRQGRVPRLRGRRNPWSRQKVNEDVAAAP